MAALHSTLERKRGVCCDMHHRKFKESTLSCTSMTLNHRLEEILPLLKNPAYVSSFRFAQALDPLLSLLTTEDSQSAATIPPTNISLTSFIVAVTDASNGAEILNTSRTRRITNIQKSYEIVHKVAEKSCKLCTELLRQELPARFFSQLEIFGSEQIDWRNENVCRLVCTMLAILSDINYHIPIARINYRSANAVRILTTHYSSASETVRLSVSLLLANLISEEENDNLHSSGRHFLPFMLSLFPKSPRRLEILRGLKTLTGYEKNTEILIRKDLSSLFEDFMIQESFSRSFEEESLVYEILWSLSFDSNGRKTISCCTLLLKAAKSACTGSTNKLVRENANGLLRRLHSDTDLRKQSIREEQRLQCDGTHGEADEEEEDAILDFDEETDEESEDGEDEDVVDSVLVATAEPLPVDNNSGFVLLTFCESAKEVFTKIVDNLKQAGYETRTISSLWETSIQIMASTVKQAVAVIFEVSSACKSCAWFREVLETAYNHQKPLIPLLLERHYNPDGWQGFLCGSSLIYDMHEDHHTKTNIGKIFKELNRRGKKCCIWFVHCEVEEKRPSPSECRHCIFELRQISISENPEMAQASPLASHSVGLSTHTFPMKQIPPSMMPDVTSWTAAQVSGWLNDLGLPKITRKSLEESGLDGALLFEWHSMLSSAPTAFCQIAKDELGLQLVDILRLTRGLRQL